MPTRMITALSIMAALLLTACGALNPTQGSGTITTETRGASGFTRIDLRTAADVELTMGEVAEVTITADDNLQALVRTRVENGWLVIDSPDGTNYRPSRPIVVEVTIPTLSEITLSGAGDIRASGLVTDSLVLTVSGAGDISATGIETSTLSATVSGAGNMTLTGSVNEQVVTISGAGNYEAAGLGSTDAVITIGGAGSASVNVTGTLDANISGGGSITYTGDPTVTQNITGSGSVTARN